MKDNYLKSLITNLNKGKTEGLIFLRPLTDYISIAKVWQQHPQITDDIGSLDPYTFYFIKNDNGLYVGAVFDMEQDLHWFVMPVHRKQQYLTKALKEVILPHLFQDREIQTITINENLIGRNNMLASQRVAEKVGFKNFDQKDSTKKYRLERSLYKTDELLLGTNTEMSESRIKEIKKHLNYLSCSLSLIQSEIEMAHGPSNYTDELEDLAEEIGSHCSHKLEDAYWDYKKRNNPLNSN